MTITSLGGIGGSFFTPIINYPEVAILGVGKAERKQVFINGKFVTRTMLPLSLSYDHRIIDGAEAARFNNELKKISEECRNLKIDKKELFGGSMTITSLGGIGGSFFTPIINYPEVAILGVGKAEKKQVFIDGKFVTRTMLPLSLSYDHRIIDGAEAARFNNELKENLGKNFAYKLAV